METLVVACKDCSKDFEYTPKWRKVRGRWCHDCYRAYARVQAQKWRAANGGKLAEYRARWRKSESYQNGVLIWSRAAHGRRRDWLANLKNKPCQDCGQSFHHTVMEYDHIGTDKVACIGHLRSRKQILVEIAKCELVCANCHRMRTHARREAKKQNARHSVFSARGTTPGLQ